MDKFIEFFSIVPIGDGYHYLCKDNNGNHFEKHKIEFDTGERLIFENEHLARQYIDKYLDVERYRPGFILYRNDCIIGTVIRKV